MAGTKTPLTQTVEQNSFANDKNENYPRTEIAGQVTPTPSVVDPTMPNEATQKQLEKDYKEVTEGQGAEIGKTEEPSGAVATSGTQTATGTVAQNVEIPTELNRQLNKTAMRGAQEASQNIVQHIWEPTTDNIKKSGLNYRDYVRGAQEAGAKVNHLDVLNAFYGKDPSKSIEENEKAEKKAKNQEKMNAIGNALMHAGNFIGSMVGGHGAVQLEDPVKFTERQRALKEKTEALQRKTWQDYYQQLKDQRADDNAKASAELGRMRLQETMDRNAKEAMRKAEADKVKADHVKAGDELAKQKFAHTVENDKTKNGIAQQRADAAQYNATHKSSGGGRSRGGSGGKGDYTDTTTRTNRTTGEEVKTVKVHKTGVNVQKPKNKFKLQH